MLTGLNRAARRKLAAEADTAARALAASCLDYDGEGNLRAVSDRLAVASLERGFARMLRDGARPQVMRLTPEAAAAFPRQPEATVIDGYPWLAVGFDAQSRATYALRYLGLPGSSLADRRLAEAIMHDELAKQCARPGFPPWGAQ